MRKKRLFLWILVGMIACTASEVTHAKKTEFFSSLTSDLKTTAGAHRQIGDTVLLPELETVVEENVQETVTSGEFSNRRYNPTEEEFRQL